MLGKQNRRQVDKQPASLGKKAVEHLQRPGKDPAHAFRTERGAVESAVKYGFASYRLPVSCVPTGRELLHLLNALTLTVASQLGCPLTPAH